MGLQVEIWKKSVEEKLLQDNSFLNHIANVQEANVIGGKIVHIPQAGEPSKVVKNRTTLPAVVKQRTDGEVLYAIDEYTTDPVRISNADTVELSYDKRRSILDQDVANLSEEVAEGMLTNMIVSPVGDHKELPTSHILETTGASVLATIDGATGNRKAFTLTDLQKMQTFMRKNRAWSEGNMYALLPAEAVAQLFPADSQLTATYMASTSEKERREGVIYKVQGWNILVRSSVYSLKGDKTFNAFGALAAAEDCEGALFWNKNMVEKAIGQMKAFARENDPEYYGDIYSFLVRVGGRARRKNYDGVAVLKQAAAV